MILPSEGIIGGDDRWKSLPRCSGGCWYVYHCFDWIVINLSGLSRPDQVVYLFREVVGVRVVDREVIQLLKAARHCCTAFLRE
jgi:hypothetical protein